MAIFFGYDNQATKDGSGAQVQRIFAIYSLAKFVGVEYANQQIIDIDFNPGDGINTHAEMQQYVSELNNFLSFLNVSSPINPILKRIHFVRLFQYKRFNRIFFALKKLQSILLKRDYLYLISNPYTLIEKYSNAYTYVKRIIPVFSPEFCNEKVSIQLHVGRAKVSEIHMPNRYTPDDWYTEILDKIISTITSVGREYEILLHTDLSAEKIWKIPTGVSPETLTYWRDSGLVNGKGRLELQDLSVLSGFTKYKNLSIISGIDPISAWRVMSNADFLLIGKSSFSFVGALLNSNGIVVSPTFWSRGPDSWLILERGIEINDYNFEL